MVSRKSGTRMGCNYEIFHFSFLVETWIVTSGNKNDCDTGKASGEYIIH